jgi:tetratricopeptide (TPR) repeat protein
MTGHLCRAEAYLRMRSPEGAVEAVNRAMLTAQLTNQPVPLVNFLGQSLEVRNAALAEAVRPAPPVVPPAPPVEPPATLVPADILTALAAPFPSLPNPARDDPPPTRPAPPAEQAKTIPVSTAVSLPLKTSPLKASVAASREAAKLDHAGRQYAEKENFQEALAMVNRAIEINPRFARAYNARGYVYLRMTNYAQAIADFSEAIRLDPAYANAYHNRSVTRKLVGETAGAASDARNAEKYSASAVSLSASR